MTKKDYLSPEIEVIEMGYRDPVCQAMSGGLDNFVVDPYTPDWII